jgi:outer membrane protein assembly factor BamB
LVFNLDGSLYWKYDYPKTPDSWGTSEVVISHNNKYLGVGTVDGRFLLLDLTTKKLLWSTDLQGQIRYALFNENDSAVFFGGDPYLYSYSTNGNLNWKTNIGAWPYSLTESKNYIFAGVKAGVRLSLINKNTGDIVWSYPVDAHPDTLLISPDESMFVYQASIGGLALKNAFFDKNGKLLFNLPSARSGMFTPDGNYMVYYSGDNVTLVNKRGSTLWSAGLDKEIWPVPRGSVWISPDTKKIIVTSSVNGNVYFFEGGVHKENTPEANSAQSTQSGSHGNLVLALALFLVISVVLVAIVIVIVRAYKKKAVNKLK